MIDPTFCRHGRRGPCPVCRPPFMAYPAPAPLGRRWHVYDLAVYTLTLGAFAALIVGAIIR
jgi:hypothetical protein